MLRCFLLILLLAVTVGAQVPIGATKKEVIDKLGWPQSTSSTEGREILNYHDYTILLADGRVDKLQFKPVDTKRPKAYSAPAPRNAPNSAKTLSPPPAASVPASPSPRPAPVGQQETPQTAQSRSTAQAPVTPQPRPDPFAPIKTALLWLVPLFVVAACLKLFIRPKARDDFLRESTKSTDGTPPLLRLEPPALKTRPDPLTDGWSLELLKKIEWHRFEHLVAAYERELGHDAKLTGFGADGGVDVQIFEPDSGTLKRVIQCKAFNNNKPVGVDLVRSFYGVMTLQKVAEGSFYTTSRFSEDALAIGREHHHLELVDGPTLVGRIQRMPLSAQLKLFDVATEGDYTTPTCASCGVKLILRKSNSGGADFWGCRDYPRCRSKIYIASA